MASTIFPQWRAEQRNNNYPFSDIATLSNGRLVIPEETFIDAKLHPVSHAGNLYLSEVRVNNNSLELVIGDAVSVSVATGTFSTNELPDKIELFDAAGRSAGLLVSSPRMLASLVAFGAGEHRFQNTHTAFVAHVCVPPIPAGVTGFRAQTLTDQDEPESVENAFSGDIILLGVDGVRLSVPESTLQGRSAEVTVNTVGDPLFLRELCRVAEDEEQEAVPFSPPRFIQKVRFVAANKTVDISPDRFGDIRISVNNALATDSVLRVQTRPNGISFGSANESN